MWYFSRDSKQMRSHHRYATLANTATLSNTLPQQCINYTDTNIKQLNWNINVFRCFAFHFGRHRRMNCAHYTAHTHTRDKIWNLCKLIGALLSSCTMQTLSFNSHMLLFVWVFIPALAAFRSPTLPITGKFITNSFLRNVICYWSIWCDLLVHTAATYHIVDLFKRH